MSTSQPLSDNCLFQSFFFQINGSPDESLHETKDNEESKLDKSLNDNKLNNSSNTQIELKKTNELKPPDNFVPSEIQDGKISPPKEGNLTPQEDKEKLTTDKNTETSSHIVTTSHAETTANLQNIVELEKNLNKKDHDDTQSPSKNASPQLAQKNLASSSSAVLNENILLAENINLKDKKEDNDNNGDNVGGGVDDDDELNIEHITSMVEKLGDDSDEEELLSHHQSRQPHVSEPSTTLDPSIVFAKKAEPGKNINGLQDWIYRDPQGEIQGICCNPLMSYNN